MFRIFSVDSLDNGHPCLSELRKRLELQGYEMVYHCQNQEMVSEIKSTEPDLILLDPTLPEYKGFEVCETLKSDPETENIPIIFVHTGQNTNGSVLKSFESGATDFVSIETGEIEMMARMTAAIRDRRTAMQSVALAQQLNKMNTELYEHNLQVEKELYIARQLQQSLLPPFLPEDPDDTNAETPTNTNNTGVTTRFSKCHYKDERLRITGVYLPCDALGGDLYDVIQFPNGTVGVSIADVSGHGVPAGFITAIFKSSFYRITHSHSNPNDILFHLNNELADIVKTGEYVTAVYSRLQWQDEKLIFEFSGAGHPYPLLYSAATDTVERLKENGTPLVWLKNADYPLGRIELNPGDRLLLFTDGLTEMRNIHGALYGEDALDAKFLDLVHQNPKHLLDELIQHLSDYTEGHPLEDDLSVVLIEAV
jgi:sigma-B regulation protein RsbU (phosphoserine phosphatase)